MATDKMSMKLRLQEIGKLVHNIPGLGGPKKDLTERQKGYQSGMEDMAAMVRGVLNSPVKGHTDAPDYEAKTEFLEQRERAALREWKNMPDWKKETYVRREATLADSGDGMQDFMDFADEMTVVLPTARVTYFDNHGIVQILVFLDNTLRSFDVAHGKTFVTIGEMAWVK